MMDILVFAGCNDKKLLSKIDPFLESELVDKVYLVREDPMEYIHSKLIQYPSPKAFKKVMPLRELARVIIGLYLMVFKRIDILVGIHAYMHGVYAYIFSKIFRKKLILHIIEQPGLYNGVWHFKMICRGADAIAVRGSRSIQQVVGLGVSASKVFISHNVFTIDKSIKLKGFVEKRYDLAYWGNFVDVKDLPLWVEVFSLVKERIPDLKGLLLGDGILWGSIKKLIRDRGLEDSIDLPGRKKEVNGYINDTKLLLMTSKSEGLPMDIIEAMALGVPSIAPDVGDINDVVKDGVNGFVIKERDPRVYAEKVLEILENPSKYKLFSTNSKSTLEKLSRESTRESSVKLWNLVLSKL